ncbi:MAG: hypothetical protein OIF40_08205 [Mangrovicoccus sp.]|nr:hypothetical protein [Mangrovicoccus sp.]
MQTDAPFEGIDFGAVPDAVNDLLQQGVLAHRTDKHAADALFRQALALDPSALPTYFCLYKIHTYAGRLPEARAMAEEGLQEAARQAGWSADWRDWWPAPTGPHDPGRFALYTLKALAFIALRQGDIKEAEEILAGLAVLDPLGEVGWMLVAKMAESCAA